MWLVQFGTLVYLFAEDLKKSVGKWVSFGTMPVK